MKHFISTVAFIFLLCAMLNCASADRYVNSADCNNLDDFLNAIEMGTTVTAEGYVYIADSTFSSTMDDVEGYYINIIVDIKGCIERHFFIMATKEQAANLEKDDYVTISGKMFSRGNTGKHYYINTQTDNGFVEKKEVKPEPTILDLNEEKFDMVSRVQEHRIGDIAKGNGLEIVKTQESNITSSTTYYFILQTGNLRIQFYTKSKDLFKGDIIDFEGTIYNYDVDSRTLLCRDPVYQLHDSQ